MEERGCRVCVQDMLKSGTVWKVISVIMPRAPRERRAARKRVGLVVGLQVMSWELERRMVRDVMDWERRPCFRLEPWVPVLMLPATD